MKHRSLAVFMSVVAVLVLSLTALVDPVLAATLTVDGGDPGCSDVSGTPYCTIQAAVDDASAGDTVNIAAGTYDEQVVIGVSITLQGAGNTTIIRPSAAAMLTSLYELGTQGGALWNGDDLASIVLVENVGAAGVTISDLKIDGQDVDALPAGANYVVGLSYGETGGMVSNVVVEDMDFLPDATRSYGMWFDAVGGTAVSAEVDSSTVQFYNRNGINARGNSMTVNIHDSEVDGAGPVPGQVLNGILLINGADGQIVDNDIHDNGYIGDTWKGSGILLYQTVTGILISGNEIHDTDDAIILNATN